MCPDSPSLAGVDIYNLISKPLGTKETDERFILLLLWSWKILLPNSIEVDHHLLPLLMSWSHTKRLFAHTTSTQRRKLDLIFQPHQTKQASTQLIYIRTYTESKNYFPNVDSHTRLQHSWTLTNESSTSKPFEYSNPYGKETKKKKKKKTLWGKKTTIPFISQNLHCKKYFGGITWLNFFVWEQL